MKTTARNIAGICVLLIATVLGSWAMWRQSQISKGERAFAKYGCASCHANGGGPSLKDATKRHDRDMLVKFIENPQAIYRERNYQTLNEGWMQMPTLHVDHAEAKAIVTFLDSQ